MSKFLFALALVAALTVGPVAAQTVVVDYVDGAVDLKLKTGAWQPLGEGAKLTPDSTFRLKDGVVELSSGTTKWHVGKDGTYQVSALTSRTPPAGSKNVAGLVGDKLSKLLGVEANTKVQTANAGVRAAEQPATTLEWADDEPAPDTIESLVQKADWPKALAAVSTALANHPDDIQGLLFTKARILSNQGRAAGAIKALNDAKLQKADRHFLEAALLYATQGIEAQQFDLVLAKTDEALATVEDPELTQMLTLGQALAYQGLGDAAKAKGKLQAVVKLGVDTPAGAEANRLLGS